MTPGRVRLGLCTAGRHVTLSVGLARAEAYERQVKALGESATAFVNSVEALSKSNVPFVPSTLVMGSNGGGALEGLMALMMRQMGSGNGSQKPLAP